MKGTLHHNGSGKSTIAVHESGTEEKLDHTVSPPDSVHDAQSLKCFLEYVASKDGIGTALEKTIKFDVPVSVPEVDAYLQRFVSENDNKAPTSSQTSASNTDGTEQADPTYIPEVCTKTVDKYPYVPMEGTKLKSGILPILWGLHLVFGASADAKATLIGNPHVALVWKTKKTSRNYMVNHPSTVFVEPEFIQEVTPTMQDPASHDYCDTVRIYRKHRFEEWGFRLKVLNRCWCSGIMPNPTNTKKHLCSNAYLSVLQARNLFGKLLAFLGVLACAGLSLLSPTVNAASVDKMEGINRDNLLLLALVQKLCPFAVTFYENSPNIVTSLGATVMESVYRTSVQNKRSVTVVMINTKKLGGPGSNQDRQRSGIYTTPDVVYGEGGFVVEPYARTPFSPKDTAQHAQKMLSGNRHVREVTSNFHFIHMKVLRTVFREEGEDPPDKSNPSFLVTYSELSPHGSQKMSVGLAELLVHEPERLSRAITLIEKLIHADTNTTSSRAEDQAFTSECAAILKNYRRLQSMCAGKTAKERRQIAIGERRDFPEINHKSMNKTIVGSMATNLVDGETFKPIKDRVILSNMSQPHSTVIVDALVSPIDITRDMPGSLARDTVYIVLLLMEKQIEALRVNARTELGRYISEANLHVIERMTAVVKEYCQQNRESPVPTDIKISRSVSNFVLHTDLNRHGANVFQSFTSWGLSVGHTNINKSSSADVEVNKFGVEKYITFADAAHKKFVMENKEILISALKKANFTPSSKLLMPEELAYSGPFVTAFWATLLATRVAHITHSVWQLRNGYVNSVMAPPMGDVCTYLENATTPGTVVALIQCPQKAFKTFKENGKIVNLYSAEAVAEYEKLPEEQHNTVHS